WNTAPSLAVSPSYRPSKYVWTACSRSCRSVGMVSPLWLGREHRAGGRKVARGGRAGVKARRDPWRLVVQAPGMVATFDRPAAPYRCGWIVMVGSLWSGVGHGHRDKRSWAMASPPKIVMAGRVPATHAPAVVQPPRRSHRPGVGGRDTPGHDGESHDDPGGIHRPRPLILMPI